MRKSREVQRSLMTDRTSGPTPAFLSAIGHRVRDRRHHAGLTVQQLADESGLSRRMLTQIELGQANPSLVTIDKVARALGTTFASLARDDSVEPIVVSAPDQTAGAWESQVGSRASLHVATTHHPPAELWEWTLQPHDGYRAEPDPEGSEELIFVVTGSLTITVDDGDPVTLRAGYSARLASDRPYSYDNTTSRPTRFVRVVQLAPEGRRRR